MNTDKLVELFREEVEKLEKEAYERGKRDAFEKSIEEPVQPLSANQQRKELIEQAREFITTHKNVRGGLTGRLGYKDSWGNICDAEFIVNDEKRTVVVLLKEQLYKRIETKGIAKCHPDEVFNADIGKAIALARALEVDVPKEFLNAVQPTELVKGQYVELHDEDCGELHVKGEITEILAENIVSFRRKDYIDCFGFVYEQTTLTGLIEIIINDTNAKY